MNGQLIQFYNWSDDVFVGQAGQETFINDDGRKDVRYKTFTFDPRSIYEVPVEKAIVFARQLAQQQSSKIYGDVVTNDRQLEELMIKAFPGKKPSETTEVDTFQKIKTPKTQEKSSTDDKKPE